MVSELPLVFVTCAAGSTGLELVKLLSKSGKFRIRAGVRSVEKHAPKFQGLENVEVVKHDDTETSKDAFNGIDYLYLIIALPVSTDPSFDVWLRHATSSSVKFIIYHSSIGAQPDDPVPLNRRQLAQEEAIRATGIRFTFLRPTFFHQNIDKYHLPEIPTGGMLGASKGAAFTSVDVRDIAAVAAKVFEDPKTHEGKIYTLTGDLITDNEIAGLISKAIERPFVYHDLTKEQFTAQMSSWGLDNELVETMVLLSCEKADGLANKVHPDIEQLLGRKGITFAQYISEIAPLLKQQVPQ